MSVNDPRHLALEKGHFEAPNAQANMPPNAGLNGRLPLISDDEAHRNTIARRARYRLETALEDFKVEVIESNPGKTRERAREKIDLKKEEQDLKERLARGEIPPILIESWRLVPFESQSGQQFNQEMLGFARKLYQTHAQKAQTRKENPLTHHDFDKQPIRFMISDQPEPNAWFVRGCNPPLVVFTKGMFEKGEEADAPEPPINSFAELALVLGHEVTHMKVRETYGEVRNSKAEEGVAYAIPMDILVSNGLNPEIAPYFFKKFTSSRGKKVSVWEQLADDHPTDPNVQAILQNYLAYLRKERGDLKPETEPEPLNGQSHILHAVREGKHISHVQSELAKVPDYPQMDIEQKMRVWISILDEMNDVYRVRVADLCKEMRPLQKKVTAESERVVLHQLANTSLTLMQSHPALGQEIYMVASQLLDRKGTGGTPALGRLRSIRKGMKQFVEATTTNADANDIIEAAESFLAAVDKEPLSFDGEGVKFLMKIHWPQFPYPNIEQFIQDQRRAKRNNLDPEDWQAPVPWQPLRELSAHEPAVVRAAFVAGLGADWKFHEALGNHRDVALQVYSALLQASLFRDATLRQVSKGPSDGRSTLKDLYIDDDGYISQVDIMAEDDALDPMAKKRNELIAINLSNFLLEDFQKAGTDAQAEDRVRLLANAVSKIQKRGSGKRLICFDICEHNLPLFMSLNEDELCGELESAQQFVRRLTELVKLPDGATYCDDARSLFTRTVEGGDHVYMSLCHLGPPLRDDGGYDQAGWDTKRDVTKGRIAWNPYLQFLLDNPSNVFSQEEQVCVYERKVSPYVHNELFPSMDADIAKGVLESLAPAFKKFEREGQLFKNAKWPDVIQRLQKLGCQDTAQTYPDLERLMLLCEAIKISGRSKPTLDQTLEFVRAAGVEQVRQMGWFCATNRDRITKHARALIDRGVTAAAAEGVKLLSDASLLRPKEEEEYLSELPERIAALEDVQARLELSELLFGGQRLGNPRTRVAVITIWAEAVHEMLGNDDGTPEYQERVLAITTRVQAKVTRLDHAEIFARLAKELQTQRELTLQVEDRSFSIKKEDVEEAHLAGFAADSAFSLFRKKPETRQSTLQFLMTPLSDRSIEVYLQDCKEMFLDENLAFGVDGEGDLAIKKLFGELYPDDSPYLEHRKNYFEQQARQKAGQFYENFWSSPLEARAVIARELLVPTSDPGMKIDNATFDYVIDKTCGNKSNYQEYVRDFVRAYVDALPYYQQHVALAAMMVASEKTNYEGARIGEALALFAENMDPATTKLAQAAESHPSVPEDIRQDLRRLKCHASEPNRWDVMRWIDGIKSSLEDDYNRRIAGSNGAQYERATLIHIGDVIGSGSLYVAVEVTMSDGTNHVLSLLRPDALKCAETGFSTIRTMADNLGQGYPALQIVDELIDQSSRKLKIETNCSLAPAQYGKAEEMYNDTSVTVDDETFVFSAAKVTAANGNCFMMKKIPGAHFLEMPEDTTDALAAKKRRAMAILTVELTHILLGQFDNDRHGGNVKLEGNQIGHFDFKAMSLEQWGQEGFEQFAQILVGAISNTASVQDFANALLSHQKQLRDSGTQVHPFVTETQKAILSLGEYPRMLTPQELQRVVLSALSQGIHPRMIEAVMHQCGTFPPFVQDAIRGFIEHRKIPPFLPFEMKEEELITINRSTPLLPHGASGGIP